MADIYGYISKGWTGFRLAHAPGCGSTERGSGAAARAGVGKGDCAFRAGVNRPPLRMGAPLQGSSARAPVATPTASTPGSAAARIASPKATLAASPSDAVA